MDTVHRFTDPAYADLTVRMRAGDNPETLFDQLAAMGLVRIHESVEAAHDAIAAEAKPGMAISVATNDEARQLNQRIRALRVAEGTVDDDLTLTGMDGLLIGKGDVIQTRRNDSELQVTNRQTWTVQHVDRGGIWVRELGAGANARTVALPAEYVAASAHLAYAVTTYGVQGATVDRSHTVFSDATSAAGVYVGMTRGRQANQPHIVAANLDDAREQFTAALERDRADRGLAHATGRAAEQVRGLTADGPVKLVNAARALLASRVAEERQEEARLRREAARGREPGHVRLLEAHAEAWKARAEQTQRVLDHFTALPIEEAAGIIAEQVQARSERLNRNAARDALAEQSVTPSVERDIGPRLGM